MTKPIRQLLTALVLCLSFSLSAQLDVETKHFPLYKKVNYRATHMEFARYLGNGETISMWTTVFYGDMGNSKFVKSSGDNPIVLEKKIEGEFPLSKVGVAPYSKTNILLSEVLGNELLVAYRSKNKKDGVTELRIARVNTETLDITSDEVFMAVKRFSSIESENGHLSVSLSPDKSRIAALGVDGTRKGSGSAAKVKTLNLETEETMEAQLNFDKSYSINLKLSEVIPLSDNGAALSFRIIYPINERRLFKETTLAAPHEYLLKVVDGSGKEAFSQIIEAEERVFTDVKLGETSQGTLTVAGWLADKELEDVNELYSSTGAFSTSLSLSDFTLGPITVVDFGNDLLGKTRMSPSSKMNALLGYVNLTTLDTFVGSDGALWMVAEEQIGWTTTSASQSTTTLLGVDVLVARVSSSGEIEWVDKLAANVSGYGLKTSWLNNDELYVVFKDSPNNEGILGGGFSSYDKDGFVLALGHFSKTGEVQKKHFPDYFKGKKAVSIGGFAGSIEDGVATIVSTKRINHTLEVKLK